MIILGLDPGLATTGFAVIDYTGSKFTVLSYGVLSTPADMVFPSRLNALYQDVLELFKRYKIDEVAVEELFFSKNVKTAISVAHARGVLLLAAEQHNVHIQSYTPPQVKLGICGYGNAEKKQVQYMAKQLLNLDEIPKPDDAADAVAVAICHAHSRKISSKAAIR